jgi:excinuclease UvrABC nuclease subunit
VNLFENACKLDVILKPNHYTLIQANNIIGVYVLFIKKEPMYVGKSYSLRKRLASHFNKSSEKTQNIIDEVDEIGICFANNREEVDFLETAFIHEFNPPLNGRRNKLSIERMILRKYTNRCNNINKCGAHCKKSAHTNGYCTIHGGDGITREMLAKKDVDEIINSNLQLRLII